MPLGPESRSIEDRETIHRPERGGEGRSARKIVPRRALADWDPAGRGHDALATILAQSETRAQDLVPIRHGRMAVVIDNVGGTTDGFGDERNRQRYYQTRQLGGKQIVEHAVVAILTLPVRQSDRQRQQPRHNGEQRDASGEVLDSVKDSTMVRTTS